MPQPSEELLLEPRIGSADGRSWAQARCRDRPVVLDYLTRLTFSYVDVVVVIAVGVGIHQGRKRGVLGESIDLFAWILIVCLAGFGHPHLARYICWVIPGLSTLAGYLISYVSIASLMLLIAGSLKRRCSEKLLNSDAFGAAEYYLGMMAGGIRMSCLVVAAMALLNAREYTPVEVQARESQQEQNFGSIRFFRLYSLQADVFAHSISGKSLRTWVPGLLIESTHPSVTTGSGQARARTSKPRQNPRLDP